MSRKGNPAGRAARLLRGRGPRHRDRERAIAKFGAPIYVRHEIVHNTYVVNDLKAKGAIFIEELADVPPGATLVFSAHGVSRAVQQEAAAARLQVFDATCPLVTKVHVEVAKLAKEGYEFIMIGHKGHPEVEGTMGQLDHGIHLVEDVADVAAVQPRRPSKLAVVTQTTLSVDDAAEISAAVRSALSPGARAQAAGHLLRHAEPAGRGQGHVAPGGPADCGGQPHQLQQQPPGRAGRKLGVDSLHGRFADELQAPGWKARPVGLTAGASAPEMLVPR
jgi:4-hydroxy-3-methylbut-2-enyl diphosphate reductase